MDLRWWEIVLLVIFIPPMPAVWFIVICFVLVRMPIPYEKKYLQSKMRRIYLDSPQYWEDIAVLEKKIASLDDQLISLYERSHSNAKYHALCAVPSRLPALPMEIGATTHSGGRR